MISTRLTVVFSMSASVSVSVSVEEKKCDSCGNNRAEIFQVNGDFCLDCW